MKLNGVNILSVEMMRQGFNIEELFRNADIGSLWDFERKMSAQNNGRGMRGQGVAEEIYGLLSKPESVLELLSDGELNVERLNERIRCFSDPSFGDSVRHSLQTTIMPLQRRCLPEQARDVYLFLLLHMQIWDGAPVRESAWAWLRKRLDRTNEEKNFIRNRLAICERGVYALSPERMSVLLLRESGPEVFWKPEANAPIASIACSREMGLFAVMDDGGLYVLPERASVRKMIGNRKVSQAALFGEQYVLLTWDGQIAGNLKLGNHAEWKDIRWISLGLNCLTGILAPDNHVLQFAPVSGAPMDFTGARYAEGRCVRDEKRFLVLLENETLYMDVGEPIRNVEAACLTENGYLFAVAGGLYLRPFSGSPESRLFSLPDGFRATEIHHNASFTLCGGWNEKEEMFKAVYYSEESGQTEWIL